MMLVISNSSPIIALNRIGKLDILNKLYKKILIPKAVENEIISDPLKKIEISKLPWLKTTNINQTLCTNILSVDLGAGESETIGLALELKADLILLDEMAARSLAESLDIRFTGTLGVLLKAKQKGFISLVKESIDNLINHEFRVSRQLYENILTLAKEK